METTSALGKLQRSGEMAHRPIKDYVHAVSNSIFSYKQRSEDGMRVLSVWCVDEKMNGCWAMDETGSVPVRSHNYHLRSALPIFHTIHTCAAL